MPDKNDKDNFIKKTKFLDFLRHNGYTVKTKPLKYKKINQDQDGSFCYDKPYFAMTNIIKKGVDVALACEMIKMVKENAFDVAILVSGDNDFTSVIELVQDMGKNVEVASFKNAFGSDLKQVSNKLINLDIYKGQFELEKRHNKFCE